MKKKKKSKKDRDGSRTSATSKMKLFVKIVTKRRILDVVSVLDPPLKDEHKGHWIVRQPITIYQHKFMLLILHLY